MTSILVSFSRIDSKLFMYFVDAPGQEKLKAYQSIEAYYYYQRLVALNGVYIHFYIPVLSGWVQTILYHSIHVGIALHFKSKGKYISDNPT